LFNNLDLLICYDRKIWQRKYELGDMDLRA
jgi:hypothetical protein